MKQARDVRMWQRHTKLHVRVARREMQKKKRRRRSRKLYFMYNNEESHCFFIHAEECCAVLLSVSVEIVGGIDYLSTKYCWTSESVW